MIIYVNTPSGWTIGVNLRSSDTITDLKVRIEDEEWIPQDRQYLSYLIDKLENGHTFESYGIGDQGSSSDKLAQLFRFSSDAQLATGEMIKTFIEGINTIGNLKSQFLAWVLRGKGAKFYGGQDWTAQKKDCWSMIRVFQSCPTRPSTRPSTPVT